ncbi:MAG TPA: type II toxin-antitoxin system RelE/ParE family toxin [Chitinophagaceae bacterium]
MGKYILSKKAIEDISSIWDYTFEVWSESQADKYYNMIIDCCQEIASNKISGKKYVDVAEGIYGTRIGQHIIFYRKSTKGIIEVARILHSRMDLKFHIE